MPLSIITQMQNYFSSWAGKRAPRATQVILRQKTIYILPSKQGFAFLLLVFLIWLLGTNYQNNLILGLSFFLLSIMLVSMLHAFKNLLGLTFTPGAVQTATLGEDAPFEIVLTSQRGREHHSILLALPSTIPVLTSLSLGQAARVRLVVRAQARGWMALPRITVKSYFPLGLIRAWAYVELDHRALIFPRAIASEVPPLAAGQGGEGQAYALETGDEFQGFQSYQQGMPLTQIAWKQYARGAGLFIKDYRATQAQQYWLDWRQSRIVDPELRLSNLCHWVLTFSSTHHEFGLLLPATRIDMGSGEVHKIQALTALALAEVTVDRAGTG